MSKTQYFPAIDGLRAIAVSAVIAYHFSPALLPGGYLGVDIFFVISGFLITKIIWTELQAGEFTLLRFYERRIRRIMPALLAVLLVSGIAALVILLPADLIGFGKSAIATLLFAANIYFWRDTNYFARSAEEKPLLHLWSLGVEEQFYLFFPLLLMLVVSFARSRVFALVVLLTICSLALNSAMHAIGGANPAFFLLPSRAWELGAGALIALAPVSWTHPSGRRAHGFAVAGLILIAIALFVPLPRGALIPAALPAIAGTVLLLWVILGRTSPFGGVLSTKPMVFLGQISYSLYLWHWPVIVFAKYYLVREFTLVESLLALVLMVALATLSWRYLERPFRRGSMSLRRVLTLTGAGSLAAAALGFVMIVGKGLPGRLPPEAAAINAAVGTHYRCGVTDYLAFGGSRACTLNLPSRDPMDAQLVLFGNSHAQMYAPLVRTIITEQEKTGILVPMNGCLPTVSLNINAACLAMARRNLETILSLPATSQVILAFTWHHEPADLVNEKGAALAGTGTTPLSGALVDLIQRLQAAGKSVSVIGPIATPGVDIASILSRERAFGWPETIATSRPKAEFDGKYAETISQIQRLPGVNFIRPDSVICDADRCYFVRDGRSIFADSNHIAAAELKQFEAIFREAMTR